MNDVTYKEIECEAIKYADNGPEEDWSSAKRGYMAGAQDWGEFSFTRKYTEAEWFNKTKMALEAYYRYHGIKRDNLPEIDNKFLERLCVGLLQLALEKTI